MGNNLCTSAAQMSDQSEIMMEQQNSNAINSMEYKQQQLKNTLNTKKQSLKQAKCFKQLHGSKSLHFGFEKDYHPQNTQTNTHLNCREEVKEERKNSLQPILFSVSNFSTDFYLKNSISKKQLLGSNHCLNKYLSSTFDQQDCVKEIDTLTNDFDFDFLQNQEQINIKRQHFIRVKRKNIQKDYSYMRKLGEGTFGQVYQCRNLHTHELRAVKILKKNILINPQVKQNFLHEFNLLKTLEHPNIIKVFQIYQMSHCLCIVSELCQGNTLGFYLKTKNVKFEQQTSRQILRQVLLGVNYLHHMNVVHRDLKPDNIVFINQMTSKTKPGEVDLRIIDFGLAVESENIFKDWACIGTYNYMAPEVFNGIYSCKSDSWSCGLIAYLLLASFSPFKGHDRQQVKAKINQYSPSRIDFKKLKPQAIDLLVNLTNTNYILRWGVNQALESKYFSRQQTVFTTDISKDIVLKKLSSYYQRNQLVAAAQAYLSLHKIKQVQQLELAKCFYQINVNQNGFITLNQLQSYFSLIPKQAVLNIFNRLDKNHSGSIDFGEFVAAMLNKNKLFSQKNIQEVFDFIDCDKNGQISKQQLKYFLQSIDKNHLDQLMKSMNQDIKRGATFQEFHDYISSLR